MREEGLLLLFVFIPTAIIFGLWLYGRQRRSRELIQARMQIQTRVLDHFDSAQEFAGFLQTEGGQKFLAGLSDERGWRPAKRIVTGVSIGVVLVVLSLAFFVMAMVEMERRIAFPGFLGLSLGIGFLVASLASYKLSKAWGLIGGEGGEATRLDLPARAYDDAGGEG